MMHNLNKAIRQQHHKEQLIHYIEQENIINEKEEIITETEEQE